MLKKQSYSRHLTYSVVMHFFVLLALMLSFEWSAPPPVIENSNKNINIVNAIAIDAPALAEINNPPKLKEIAPKLIAAKMQPKPAEPVPKPPVPPKVIPLIKPKEVPTKKIALKPMKKLKPELIEKQLLADLKHHVQKQKKAKQKELELALAKELKEEMAKSIKMQIDNDAKTIPSVRTKQIRGQVDKYKALILHAISRHWLVPTNVNRSLSSELMIRLAPGGDVLEVQIVRSSGNPYLDRSARDAVFKASPLPVPSVADGFENFRQFVLKVKPENIVNNENWVN